MKILCALGILLLALASSANMADTRQPAGHEAQADHNTSDTQSPILPCDRLPGPLIKQLFLQLEANVRTTVKLKSDSLAQSFILFDNIVDRRCTVVFTSQPEFWRTYSASDSCFALPLPLSLSGLYEFIVERLDTTYTKRCLFMK